MPTTLQITSVFVVHEHHTVRPHWDFRLKLEGVLKSWTIPKRLARMAGIKRLSIQVDDDELQCADYEGEMPEGEYGAGPVSICDRGECKSSTISEKCIKLELFGVLFKGKHVLYRFAGAGESASFLFKTKQKRLDRHVSRAGG